MQKENDCQRIIAGNDLCNFEIKKMLELKLSDELHEEIGFDVELQSHVSSDDIRFMIQLCQHRIIVYIPEKSNFDIGEIRKKIVQAYHSKKDSPDYDADSLRRLVNNK